MKTSLSNIELLTTEPVRLLTVDAVGDIAPQVNNSPTMGITEKLMPYEAAAKGIFVKANGLWAYYKATGTGGLAYLGQSPARRRRHTDL
jgi:hypothetical protein